MTERTYAVVYEQDPGSGRYTASVPALDCVTEGDTLDEARQAARELITLEIRARSELGLPIPEEHAPPPVPLVEQIAAKVP